MKVNRKEFNRQVSESRLTIRLDWILDSDMQAHFHWNTDYPEIKRNGIKIQF